MTDLEIIKRCAEAIGMRYAESYWAGIGARVLTVIGELDEYECDRRYNPLHDDAQAMALVKRFNLYIYPRGSEPDEHHNWQVSTDKGITAFAFDLNRAICECVAKMQA